MAQDKNYRTFVLDGQTLDIPTDNADKFLAKYPDAKEHKSFVLDNDTIDIPIENVDAFVSKYPDAKPTYADIKKKEVTQPLVKPVEDFTPSATGPLKESFQLPSQSSSGLKEFKKGSPLQEPTGIPKFDTPSPFKQDDSWRVPMVPDKDMIIGTDEQGNEISVNPKAELEKRLDKYRVPVYARTADSPDAGGIYFNESLVDESMSKIEKIDKDLEFLSSVHHPSYKEINRLKDEREALNQVISKNNISKIDALKRESGAAYTIDGVPVNFSVMYAKSFDPDFITSVKEGKSNIGVQNDDELSTHFNTQVKNVGAWSDPVESFVSGAAGIGAGIAHLPDFMWQSIYTLGSGGKIGKVPQAENPLRDKLSAVSDEYAAKQFQYKDGILESLKNGNVADAVKQTTNAVSGSLPYTGLAAATGGLGVVPSGLILTGVSASQKNLDGTANEVDAATELVYDWLYGAAESGGELITQKILFKQIDSYSKNAKKLYKEALKTGSKEAADAYIKELSEQSAKNIVKDVAKNTRTSMTEEGLSEAATAVAQGIFGNITGAEPQSASQIVNNAIESAIVGSVSGGGMAQVGNIGLTSAAITSIGDRNKLRDLNREIELLGDKILASDVDNATKVRLMKMAKDKRHEQLNIIRDNRAKAEAMSEESRQAINEAAIERRDIEGLVSTADEELKPVLEGRMAELDKKISEMVTQAEVGVPKEQYPATEIQKGDIVAGDVFENQPTNVTNAIELFGKTPEEITRIQDMYGRGYDLTMGGIREYFKDKEANQLKPITRPLVPKKESPKPKAQPKPIKDEKQEVGMQEARGQEETEVLTESKYDQQIDQLVASGNISQDQSSAVKMESKGATANDIRKETGWFKGKYDGKWRYEINPVQVTPVGEKRLLDAANASRDNKTVELVRLKDVIEDSELLKLYPELENTKIAFYDSESEAGYSFVDGVGYISLNPKTYFQKGYGQDRAKWVHRNIAHELQHAVQLLEGFARGTSSKEVSDMLRRSAPEPQRGLPLPADVVPSVYSRFAGEIEARDVQERSTLTQKTEQDAVQEQKPDEGVLRQEGSEVELLQVEQGDSKQEITAQQGEAVQEEVKPKAAPTSPMAARLAGFAKPATEPKAAEVRPEPSPTVSKKETVKQPTTLEERIAAAKGETIGKKVDKTAQKLSEIAAKIRGGKLDNDTMMSGIPFSKQVWNGAIEVAAKAIESGASVLRAINRAIFWLNSQTWYQKLTKSNQSKAQAQLVNYLAGHTGTNPMADDMDIFIAKQSEYIANKEKTSAQDWIDALNNNLLDKRGKVKRLLKKIGATEAITRRTLSAGASSLAKERLKEYKTRVFGGLNVLEKELLNNVIQFRRIIELDNDKDSKGEPRLKHSTVDESGRKISPNKEGAEAWLAKFESTDREMYDKLNERATDYFAINKELLKERLDDGMLTQDQYDALSKLDYSKRAYVDRLFELEMLKNYSGVTSDEIKALKEGSEMMLYNNAEWLLEQNTVGTIRALFENRANRALGEFIKNNPGNGIFEYQAPIGVNSVTGEPKFKEPQVGQDQIKYRDENGVTRSIIGPSEIVEQWRGTEPILKQDVAKAVSWVSLAKPLKLFATGINPVFALSNIPRDMAHAMHFTDTYSSLMPVATAQMAKDMATVAFDAFKRKGRYIDALKEGMGMDYLTTQSKVITEGGDSPTAKAIQKLQDIAGFLNETSEIITRLAVREREIQKGLPSYQATAKARAYMDFSEGGRLTKAADTAIPYLNAATQGLRVSARAFKEKPVVTTFKIVQLMTASAALALYNMGYDDEDEKNGVIGRKHISDFVKSSNQIVMAPWTVEKDGVMVRPYFTIPITQDARPFKSLAETMIEFNKKGVFNQNQMKHSLADFVPITDVPVPPIYDAVSTYQANYDSFTDEQVWKGGDVEAKEEYKLGKTPKLYIDIGELTGMSPDRLRAASGKILTSDKSNIYTIALREGWEGATTGMDPVMKRNYSKEMDERVKSIMGPFPQKFYRYPSEREFNKNLIEQEKIKENTKRKIEEKNVVQDYVNQYWKASADKKEDLKDQFDKWAKSLDDDAEVRAKRTFKNMTKTEGVKDRFLIDLMYTDAPNAAKASSFYLKMESMPKRDRAEFYKAAKSAGIFTEGFTDEYSKVKKQRGVLEMD